MTQLLSKGLSGLGSLASAAAATAREKAVVAQARLQEAGIQDQTQAAAERAREVGSRGWGFLKSAYASAASSLEATAAANGYRAMAYDGGCGCFAYQGEEAPFAAR